MPTVFFVLFVSVMIGVFGHSRSGEDKSGFRWAAVTLVAAAVLSVAGHVAGAMFYPSVLVEQDGIFTDKLPIHLKFMAFMLDTLIAYGPAGLVGAFMFFFVLGAEDKAD